MSDFFSEEETKKQARDKKIEKRIAWVAVILLSAMVVMVFMKVLG